MPNCRQLSFKLCTTVSLWHQLIFHFPRLRRRQRQLMITQNLLQLPHTSLQSRHFHLGHLLAFSQMLLHGRHDRCNKAHVSVLVMTLKQSKARTIDNAYNSPQSENNQESQGSLRGALPKYKIQNPRGQHHHRIKQFELVTPKVERSTAHEFREQLNHKDSATVMVQGLRRRTMQIQMRELLTTIWWCWRSEVHGQLDGAWLLRPARPIPWATPWQRLEHRTPPVQWWQSARG